MAATSSLDRDRGLRSPRAFPLRARSSGQTRALTVTPETNAVMVTCMSAVLAEGSRSLPSWSWGFDSLRPVQPPSHNSVPGPPVMNPWLPSCLRYARRIDVRPASALMYHIS
jgi:hypothetical protein